MIKFYCILLFFSFQIFAAQFVKGTVTNENKVPLKDVSVYIDGSTVSTRSDENGNFSLQTSMKTGNLIFSKADFARIIFPLQDGVNKNLKVILQKENLIEEVSLIPYTDRDFEQNFSVFKYAFLGDTETTKILNKKDLLFAVDRKNNIFRAKAKRPLMIENESLGYKIQFDLMNFEKARQTLTYNGTTLYTEIPGSEKRKKKYDIQRELAYRGSYMHFFRSLFLGQTKENGFNVNAAKIIANPNYPSENELKMLNDYVKDQMEFKKSIDLDKMPKDLKIISQKAQNSKTVLVILKTGIPESDYTFRKNNELFLKFDNLLQIVCITKDHRTIDTLLDSDGEVFQIFADGLYSDPEKLIFNGTWGEYKISKMLPSDYVETEIN